MADARIAVVIPTYNGSARIEDAIRRVVGQTLEDWELVVVDDGSTDDVASVVRAIEDDRVRLVQRPNGGISAARNTGASATSAPYLTFLDDDDRVRPHWLERLVSAASNGNHGVVSCAAEVYETTGRLVERLPIVDLGPLYCDVRGRFLPATFAVRRDLFVDAGGFREGLQCSHVTEFLLRLLPLCQARGASVSAIDDVLVEVVRRPPHERPESSPAKLFAGVNMILDAHRDRLATVPAALANYYGILGVSAARLGEYGIARRALLSSVTTEPRRLRHYTRLGVSLSPALARRVWKTERYATA